MVPSGCWVSGADFSAAVGKSTVICGGPSYAPAEVGSVSAGALTTLEIGPGPGAIAAGMAGAGAAVGAGLGFGSPLGAGPGAGPGAGAGAGARAALGVEAPGTSAVATLET